MSEDGVEGMVLLETDVAFHILASDSTMHGERALCQCAVPRKACRDVSVVFVALCPRPACLLAVRLKKDFTFSVPFVSSGLSCTVTFKGNERQRPPVQPVPPAAAASTSRRK